jgi:hypothetical protein
MVEYSPAWPHGELEQAFSNVFYVLGTNRTHHAGIDLQTSRTMTVVRQDGELTLVNTVRLDEDGLKQLEALGPVKHLVRLGAFHGRDDAFYRDRYGAPLWALPNAEATGGIGADRVLAGDELLPLRDAKLFVFSSARFAEAALLLERDGGILLTCDAVQNWSHVDRFFSAETGSMFAAQGLIREANLPSTWREACAPDVSDFRRLAELPFRHLVTAHGAPLRDVAQTRLRSRIDEIFGAKP